jgi:hypothetical protein
MMHDPSVMLVGDTYYMYRPMPFTFSVATTVCPTDIKPGKIQSARRKSVHWKFEGWASILFGRGKHGFGIIIRTKDQPITGAVSCENTVDKYPVIIAE